jgi:outer membrane protein, heavy metal efflux system
LLALSVLFTKATAAGEEPLVSESGPELTLAQIEQLALQINPRLQQAAAAIRTARGQLMVSTAYPNPTLAYDAGSLGAGGSAGVHGMFVDQEFVRRSQLAIANAVGHSEIRRRQWQFHAEQLRVLNHIRRQYFELLAMQSRLELEQYFVHEIQRLLHRAKELHKDDSDEVEEPDILLARGSLRRRRLALMEAQSRLRLAQQQLSIVLNLPGNMPIRVAGSLHQGLALETSQDEEWREFLRDHPELQAARAEVGLRRATLELARARETPNVTLRAGVDYDFENDDTLGRVRLSLPLQVNTLNQGKILEAQASLQDATAELERLELSLRGRFAEAQERQRSYQAIVSEYAEEALTEARSAYEKYWKRFENEESSFSRVTTAQENYSDVTSQYLDALLELRRVEVDLSTKLLQARLTNVSVDID